MHRRIAEAIDRGPKGIMCAISLLTGNIRQAFKHTEIPQTDPAEIETLIELVLAAR